MMKMSLGNVVIVYAVTVCVFFLIDLLWLGVAAKGLYQKYIGDLLKEQVNWLAAILFYLIYIAGIQVFVLTPAIQAESSILKAALMGGLLGFFAYSTFDLTCLALFRGWPVTITVIDMAWGTLLTASASSIALWLSRLLLKI